jgi:hypothetical protein
MVRTNNADGRLKGGLVGTSLEHMNDTTLVLVALTQRQPKI